MVVYAVHCHIIAHSLERCNVTLRCHNADNACAIRKFCFLATRFASLSLPAVFLVSTCNSVPQSPLSILFSGYRSRTLQNVNAQLPLWLHGKLATSSAPDEHWFALSFPGVLLTSLSSHYTNWAAGDAKLLEHRSRKPYKHRRQESLCMRTIDPISASR